MFQVCIINRRKYGPAAFFKLISFTFAIRERTEGHHLVTQYFTAPENQYVFLSYFGHSEKTLSRSYVLMEIIYRNLYHND